MISADFLIIKGRTVEEIVDEIRGMIEAGSVPEGEALPTVRALADYLGVHRNSVAQVYKRLAGYGLVETNGRAGTKVTRRSEALIPDSLASNPKVIDLSSGSPDPGLLPDLHSGIKGIPSQSRVYGGAANDSRLVAHAEHGFQADGYACGTCVIVSGVMDGMERALDAHLMPGDLVAVEEPCFVGIINLLRNKGYTPVAVELDAEGMTVAGLQKALSSNVKALIWTPRAQNPTGTVTSATRANALKRVLEAYPDFLIIEDDHFHPLSSGTCHTLITDSQRFWAVLRSVSKALGPDLRVGFVYADEVTAGRVRTRQGVGTRWVSTILQSIALALIESGDANRRYEHAARQYALRRQLLIGRLGEAGIEAMGASGLYVWIPVAHDNEVAQALAALGWLVRTGESFRISRRISGLRVTISTMTEAQCIDFVGDLKRCLRG